MKTITYMKVIVESFQIHNGYIIFILNHLKNFSVKSLFTSLVYMMTFLKEAIEKYNIECNSNTAPIKVLEDQNVVISI